MSTGQVTLDTLDEWAYEVGNAPVQELVRNLRAIRLVVTEQAEDDGLWFIAKTAPEAYLQQELRRLHAVIEGETQ